jgi:hypothetical protein
VSVEVAKIYGTITGREREIKRERERETETTFI